MSLTMFPAVPMRREDRHTQILLRQTFASMIRVSDGDAKDIQNRNLTQTNT
jgi:hypothetical protein